MWEDMCKKITNLEFGGSIMATKIYLSQVGICMKISSTYSHLFSQMVHRNFKFSALLLSVGWKIFKNWWVANQRPYIYTTSNNYATELLLQPRINFNKISYR